VTEQERPRIIDMHTHVWPDAVARRALGASIPEMPLQGDGTIAGLTAAQDAAGVDLSVCLSVANTPERVEKVNNFAGSLDRRRFVPFGTIHPRLSPDENLRHLRAAGVAGVKLHPTFQHYRLDDPALLAVLEALAGEFPVIAHVGAGGGSDGSNASPAMLRDIVHAVPALSLIACHFGGYQLFDEAIEELAGEPVLLDTSWPPSLAVLDPARVRALIERHGVERVLFASDWPTASPTVEVAAVRGLGLTIEDTALVLGGNARRVLGL
jgi:predicted TIM-barrel fold metal-dependent hydrolase